MLTFDNSVTFSAGVPPIVSMTNFSAPEEGFIWSTGKWSEVTFSFSAGSKNASGTADLILDIHAFVAPPGLEGQNAKIYLNGLRIASAYIKSRVTRAFEFDAKILKPDDNVLVIDTPDSAAPEDFGVPDARQLGIQLYSLQIRRAE
jgi:hypothetical protein